MIIDKTWRVLTVGDGDLSFSASLLTHHQPASLTATVLDAQDVLLAKYAHNDYQTLLQQDCPVLCEFDVMDPNSWSELNKHSFDVVILFPFICCCFELLYITALALYKSSFIFIYFLMV